MVSVPVLLHLSQWLCVGWKSVELTSANRVINMRMTFKNFKDNKGMIGFLPLVSILAKLRPTLMMDEVRRMK